MYRQYDAYAKTSGNGQISWCHYYFLKEFFISDPSITPTTLRDIETIDTTENKDSDYSGVQKCPNDKIFQRGSQNQL